MAAPQDRPVPFRAALFDLDGTLLDSMGVWEEVDRRFFERHGLELPDDYAGALSGLSFPQSAAYTKARFSLPEDADAIIAEWKELAREEYEDNVRLKPDSREYLEFLREMGVRLGVATALSPDLYEKCLRRNGIYDLFDAFCSTREGSKEDGEVFLRAAAQLGVEAGECAVFEDVYEGILGAKRAGMRAYCVLDDAARHAHEKIAALADGMVARLREMSRFHGIPARCVIFTSVCDGDPRRAYAPRLGDMVLCADAGQELARRVGARPDAVLGDFDSSPAPTDVRVIRHPVEKDDTDTMLCLRYALNMGYREILIVGGLGGRFGHSVANVQTLVFALRRGARAVLDDGNTRLSLLQNGSVALKRRHGILNVFSLVPLSRGVSLSGLKYPLDRADVTGDFPIGCSNHFAADEALVSVEDGLLLLVEEDG